MPALLLALGAGSLHGAGAAESKPPVLTKSIQVEPIPPPPDVAAPPADATKTESGLAYRVLKSGSGSTHPVDTDLVTVHYTGWMQDGKMLDSSIQRGKPLTMAVKRFIPGWKEGILGMVVGEKRRIWIPEKLAFQGNPSAPKGPVVYEVELLQVEPGPEVPPPDVAAPPANAEKAKSGLAWKILKPGTGKRHPSPTSSVTVQYTGWTTDGKMFDSSLTKSAPATFQLSSVIAGWTQGLELMVEGEKRRLWIPEKLAYKGEKGKPQGMLVFDVELLAIQN